MIGVTMVDGYSTDVQGDRAQLARGVIVLHNSHCSFFLGCPMTLFVIDFILLIGFASTFSVLLLFIICIVSAVALNFNIPSAM